MGGFLISVAVTSSWNPRSATMASVSRWRTADSMSCFGV